ncbi:prolyl 3-hydroxylase OGFOD1 [Planococcus citri]|uniref:prolyl 3-hydroxylase OGFOD1 n=1 Tax=Planococcus citri TaxID=170843 RepID=UPI0031F8570A
MPPKSKLVFDATQWSLQHNETPFSYFKLNNVFSEQTAVNELRNAVSRLTFTQKMTDMFSFSATKNFWISKKSLKNAVFGDFLKFLEFFRDFLSDKFEVKLDDKISVSSSLYENKDYLLCHDDKSDDRLIAFIFYLNSSWKPEWGGSLDIFDHDENGQPVDIVHQIYPEFNSLIFFKVGNYTYHQVSEVTTNVTPRITINGWFHSKEAYNLKPLPFSDPPVPYIKTRDNVATLYLNHFASNEFTQLKYMEIIVENLRECGVMMLQNFLKPQIYTKIAKELKSSAISWSTKGPANRRKYNYAEQHSLPPMCKALLSFFQSQYMCSYLEELSSKKLFNKKKGEQEYGGLCFAEMQYWQDGCYSLLADDDNNYNIASVDVFLFFNVDKDEEESFNQDSVIQPGNIYYYEKFDTSNKHEVEPKSNSICLVVKNKNETRYVSYINKNSSLKYNVLFLSFKI